MNVKTKKTINIVLIVLLIIIFILLLLMFMWGRTLAKYSKEINSSATSGVAQPILIVDGAENIKIDGINDTIYTFSVKNYVLSDVSDVDMDYNIEIVNDSKADLEFELLKDGKAVSLKNNKTETMHIKGVESHSDHYELRIKYKNNPAITEDITGNVQVKVEAVQAEVI